ncbi:hypothetical protein HDU93_010043 [Gonapodya sp. JEL0774]|nr:hypothetical protein HDU93_010043 [Gonapodya sp. JEL0774]
MGKRGKTSQPLGKALIRSRFATATRFNTEKDGIHVADLDDGPAWSRPQQGSVTQESDLEAFLTSAVLAETSFAAERLNVSVVVQESHNNPFLLTADNEKELLKRHDEFRKSLTIPRRDAELTFHMLSELTRPPWESTTSASDLQRAEREAFLEWRRQLVVLEETHGLLITPYERNLDLWRQLWRVVERSHLIVQIVDARNPLLFRNEDLERYVEEAGRTKTAASDGYEIDEVDEGVPRAQRPTKPSSTTSMHAKRNLLLINKADFLTDAQRDDWASYFDNQGLRYAFFSAALAKRDQDEASAVNGAARAEAGDSDEAESNREESERRNDIDGPVSELSTDQHGETKSEDEIGRESGGGKGEGDSEESVESDEQVLENQTNEDANIVEDLSTGTTLPQRTTISDDGEDEAFPIELSATGSRTYYLHPHVLSQVKIAPFAQSSHPSAPRTRILNASELLELIESECRAAVASANGDVAAEGKLTVGMVGYPNVGKSSTINSLLGEKRVAVSSTPGKTKHFQVSMRLRVVTSVIVGLIIISNLIISPLNQTFHLSPTLILCDCPGLVFPSFATTKADMVANGVLPVDQLREFSGPSELVCRRVPRRVLEWTYGIRIRKVDSGGDIGFASSNDAEEYVKAEELLQTYAIARGFRRAQQGNPDESRAAKYILKDYVNDAVAFNEEIYRGKSLSAKRRKAAETLELEQRRAASLAIAAGKRNSSAEFLVTKRLAAVWEAVPLLWEVWREGRGQQPVRGVEGLNGMVGSVTSRAAKVAKCGQGRNELPVVLLLCKDVEPPSTVSVPTSIPYCATLSKLDEPAPDAANELPVPDHAPSTSMPGILAIVESESLVPTLATPSSEAGDIVEKDSDDRVESERFRSADPDYPPDLLRLVPPNVRPPCPRELPSSRPDFVDLLPGPSINSLSKTTFKSSKPRAGEFVSPET